MDGLRQLHHAIGELAIRALQSNGLNAGERATWGDSPAAAPSLQAVIADVTPAALNAAMRQVFADRASTMARDAAIALLIDVDGTEWVTSSSGTMMATTPSR